MSVETGQRLRSVRPALRCPVVYVVRLRGIRSGMCDQCGVRTGMCIGEVGRSPVVAGLHDAVEHVGAARARGARVCGATGGGPRRAASDSPPPLAPLSRPPLRTSHTHRISYSSSLIRCTQSYSISVRISAVPEAMT